jgi:hypothetical protein
MMTQKDLFAKVLMVEKPWYVHEIQFDQEAGKLKIWIDFERGSTFYYRDQESGIEGHFKAYDTTRKTWRHLLTLRIKEPFLSPMVRIKK